MQIYVNRSYGKKLLLNIFSTLKHLAQCRVHSKHVINIYYLGDRVWALTCQYLAIVIDSRGMEINCRKAPKPIWFIYNLTLTPEMVDGNAFVYSVE